MRRSYGFLVLAVIASGCGGGSGRVPSAGAPRISIAWPERTRPIAAPGSAVSAAIELRDSRGNSVVWPVERPAGTAAVTQTYEGPLGLKPGLYSIAVNFHTDPGASGTLVATAAASVRMTVDGTLLRPNGDPLGTLDFQGTLTGAIVLAGQSVDPGTSKDLLVQAVAGGAYWVPVSPGSISLEVVEGANVLRVEDGPRVTALAEGSAMVVATIDGKRSDPVQVWVNDPAITPRGIPLLTGMLRYDALRNKVWTSLLPAAGTGNSVVDLDPATGAMGAPIPVGSNPGPLALSDDGSTLYVGLTGDHSIRRVDLNTRTAGQTFPVALAVGDTAVNALEMAVQPGSRDTLAITTAFEFSPAGGPEVYDNGVVRPNRSGIYKGTHLVWTSPGRIVSQNGGDTSAAVYDMTVDAQGVTVARTVDGAFSEFRGGVTAAGNRIYIADGTVLDSASLAKVGTFAFRMDGNYYDTALAAPVIDEAANRAYFIVLGPNGNRLLAFRLDTFAPTANRRLDGISGEGNLNNSGDISLVRSGPKGLAFRTRDHVYFIDDVSGL